MEALSHFLENFYWIDICLILVMMTIGYIYIVKNTRKIVKKNTTYNEELRAMRVEIYTEYEKNFFL